MDIDTEGLPCPSEEWLRQQGYAWLYHIPIAASIDTLVLATSLAQHLAGNWVTVCQALQAEYEVEAATRLVEAHQDIDPS